MTPFIHFPCPACGSGVDTEPGASEPSCPACGVRVPLAVGACAEGPLDRCAVCRGDHFYVQKDFNRRLGLWLVVAAVLLSLFLFAWSGPAALAFLLLFALVDALLHRVLPRIAICYACGAIHRGWPVNPNHHPFDLHAYEVHELRKKKK